MRRRRLLVPLALLLVATAACGDDSGAGSSEPAREEPIVYPIGPGDAVIEIASEGGLAGPQTMSAPSQLVVIGDGRLVQPGPTTMQYPGALLPNLQERSITPEGIQQLLVLAEEHGLLAEVAYPSPDNVMDAPDTVVTISAGGESYVHRAYALGLGGEETDPARANLQAFVEAATTFASSEDSELGPEKPYQAAAYVIRAVPDEPVTTPDGLEPRVVDWPPDASVRLADVGECVELPADEIGEVLSQADELTRFVDAGAAYAVTAAPAVPGLGCV